MSARAFTLVELLAVIGIVLVIAAIAFPMYQASIARADAAQSLAQIRKVGNAVLAFTSENGGRLPECYSWPTREKIYLMPDWAKSTVAKDWTEDMWVWALVNTQNLPIETFTNIRANKQLKEMGMGPRLAYMLNQIPSMNEWVASKAFFTSPARFARPSKTILLSEVAFNETLKGNIPWAYCNYWSGWGLLHALHNEKMGLKKSNFVFMDGHAESLSPKQTLGSRETGDEGTTRWMDPSMFPNNFFPNESAYAGYLMGISAN